MLIFLIHGVGTRNADYAKNLIANIKSAMTIQGIELDFYSAFWGDLFNNKKNQTQRFIESDAEKALASHENIFDFLKQDIYRYKDRRYEFINDFLGDFLIYHNSERGKKIRQAIIRQFFDFIKDHLKDQEVHFIAHSLGSLILWDLLFSKECSIVDDHIIIDFRREVQKLSLFSITTLGSPLLVLKQFLDMDFSWVNEFFSLNHKDVQDIYQPRWVNIIHSSDLIAYPLWSAIKDEINENIFFSDQYIWLDANAAESRWRRFGQRDLAMVIAAKDAHSSYLYDNLHGKITGQIIAYNLTGKIEILSQKCIHSWDPTV